MKKRTRKLYKPLLLLSLICSFLSLWTVAAEQSAHYTPAYEKEDLSPYFGRENLSMEDYDFISRQTGLSPWAIEALRKEGRQSELYALQENFFARVDTKCEPNTLISRTESLVRRQPREEEQKMAQPVNFGGESNLTAAMQSECHTEKIIQTVFQPESAFLGQRIPVVENGDILIHFNCHVFGWRSGHAGLVVDAKNRITLEAQVPGRKSAFVSLDDWEQYPSFAVLRLRDVSKENRAEIAAYAAEHLIDIPYNITAGVWESSPFQIAVSTGQTALSLSAAVPESDGAALLSGTQCAHLVWSAYDQFGYDLDSDGGRIVTPRDLFDSPLLEIIQIYGMNLPEYL